jgi:hypothetical protein
MRAGERRQRLVSPVALAPEVLLAFPALTQLGLTVMSQSVSLERILQDL